jgi:hypothetical protein
MPCPERAGRQSKKPGVRARLRSLHPLTAAVSAKRRRLSLVQELHRRLVEASSGGSRPASSRRPLGARAVFLAPDPTHGRKQPQSVAGRVLGESWGRSWPARRYTRARASEANYPQGPLSHAGGNAGIPCYRTRIELGLAMSSPVSGNLAFVRNRTRRAANVEGVGHGRWGRKE